MDYYHTWEIEHEGDMWYKLTYKVSDGFKKELIVNQGDLTNLYALIGEVIRSDHEVQSVWSNTVKGN